VKAAAVAAFIWGIEKTSRFFPLHTQLNSIFFTFHPHVLSREVLTTKAAKVYSAAVTDEESQETHVKRLKYSFYGMKKPASFGCGSNYLEYVYILHIHVAAEYHARG